MKQGLTLIELVVSISIIILLLAAGIPAYRHFGNVNNLDQAAQDVKNAILETQSYALAPPGDAPNAFTLNGNPTKRNTFAIFFTKPNNMVIYPGYVRSSTQFILMNLNWSKKYNLPREISFQFNNSAVIHYSIEENGQIVYSRVDSTENPSPTIDLIIKSNKLSTNNSKTITINRETGKISIQ